jgi:hypothetical protein
MRENIPQAEGEKRDCFLRLHGISSSLPASAWEAGQTTEHILDVTAAVVVADYSVGVPGAVGPRSGVIPLEHNEQNNGQENGATH